MTSSGHCDPRFAEVQEEFDRNFAERDEVGASLCVIVDGEPVIDLWGGVADPSTGAAWERDTLNVIMSCSKGLTATCFNMLVDRGLVDLESPVSTYWPEFAQHGKQAITVRQVASHQSGVAHVDGTVPAGGFNDWDLMTDLVAGTSPAWEPGTRAGYHAFTLGFILGEIVRRVDGRTIGGFFQDEVAKPLGLDCWIGLPEEQEHRVAPSTPFDMSVIDPASGLLDAFAPGTLLGALFGNIGEWVERWDTRESHAAEVPAAGAVTNARGLAGHYAPLSVGGTLDGVRLLSPEHTARLGYQQAVTDVDAVLSARTSYTLGYSKSWPNPALAINGGNGFIIGQDAFGTPGMGGQVGFADPSHRLAFGYTMNSHGFGTGVNARGQSLVDSVYRILGSPGNDNGYWARKP